MMMVCLTYWPDHYTYACALYQGSGRPIWNNKYALKLCTLLRAALNKCTKSSFSRSSQTNATELIKAKHYTIEWLGSVKRPTSLHTREVVSYRDSFFFLTCFSGLNIAETGALNTRILCIKRRISIRESATWRFFLQCFHEWGLLPKIPGLESFN